jgi:hypothetical protein
MTPERGSQGVPAGVSAGWEYARVNKVCEGDAMSLVTAQGIRVRDEFSRDADQLRGELLQLLQDGPLRVSEILNHFPKQSEHVVREAMWRLIDSDEAEIAPSRQLRLTAP